MFRRSRFSIRPNVGTAGRTAATPQEAPSVNQEASETPKDVSESNTTPAVTDNKSVVTPAEKPSAPGDGNDQNGEGTSSSAAVQRRKRFSVKPKVAPGRPSTLARTPKSPVKAVSGPPVEVPVSDHEKPTTSGQTAAPQGLQSPRRRRPSEDSKQPKVQPKSTLSASDSSAPSAVPPAEDSPQQTHLPVDSGKQLEITSDSQLKEVPSRLHLEVPPSLPDKEAIEISEKAKTLVSSKSGLSVSAPAFSLSRLLNDPSDLQRLAKARKLRELLRQEMHKEKKSKRAKARVKEFTLDPAKMTMRDLIRYLPMSNPMSSSLEDPAPENETVVPPSPGREESPERPQEPAVLPKIASPREDVEEEEAAEEEQEEALMVPQVKVAEDGSLIIDEESLTVEVQRAKGPNPAQDRDPIFERGSTTTYSSFRKGTYSKPWSSEETDMFFLAISMVGTDFSMICQLFPHRARSEIKNKFKKEERANAWRIDKAFRERRKLDIEYFSKLLEKILEVQKNRKKLKSLADKNTPKKNKRKSKGKKAAKKLSDVEEEDEEEENDMPDLEGEEEEEEEGEKENEDLCNEGGTPASKPEKKRKRKNKQDASTEEPNDKKNKKGEKSSDQDEAYIPEDAEAALPEDRANSDISEKSENVNAAKDAAIKPAKLSRGRAPKPLLPLGRKWGKKLPTPSAKAKDAAPDKGDESVSEGASEEKVNKDASPIRQANKRKAAADDISSEEEDAAVQPPRPTRYGRVPKPINPLNYPAKDDAQASASETTPASPAGSAASAAKPKSKCSAKRGRSSKPQSAQESKKPKLVTLRASQTESSDEENEKQGEEEEEEVEEDQHPGSSKDSIAPAFVPASLRSPQPVISEVEETMEELDILANMPDVLGISQDALCPDASCELAQNETGTAEPCEHQLDLLVDVIDFLSSEHTEVSEEESYNEAAQTLLTIGNLAHLSQSAQNLTAILEHTTGTTSASGDKTSQHEEEEIASTPSAQEDNNATPLISATSGQGVTERSETVPTVEPQNTTADSGDVPAIDTSEQMTGSDVDPTPQLQSSPERSKTNSPQTRRGRLSKVKPKPNLSQASRSAQSKSQPETRHTVSPDVSQATETPLATEDTHKIADCSQKLPKADISCIEPSLLASQEESVGQVKSVAATSDQSSSENQSHGSSDAKFEPSVEQANRDSTNVSTDEILTSHAGTAESSRNNLVTESQVTNIDSAPIQQSDHPAPCVAPVDLPVCQKEEGDDASARQTRKSRFQKVKPKPNLAQTSRTARSKPQATKDTEEKDASPTPTPKFCEKTKGVEAEPTCSTLPEKSSQSPGPASDLIPALDLGCILTPTEELSVTEEKKTDVGLVGQVQTGATGSDQRASENQNFPEAQFEPRREDATRDTRPISESTEEKLMPHVGTTESSNNLLSSDTAVPDSQTDSPPVQESSNHPAPPAARVEELTVSRKEESQVASTSQTRRGQKVKPKPNLPQTSRTMRSKPQTTEDPVKLSQPVEKPSSPTSRPESTDNIIPEVEAQPTCSTTVPGQPSHIKSTGSALDSEPSLDLISAHKPTEELPSTKGQRTDGGSSEGSEQSLPQRRQRFPKVKPKPNLGSSTRTTLTKLQGNDSSKPTEQRQLDISSNVTSEQQPVDNNDGQTEVKPSEKDLASTHCSLDTELLSSTRLGSAESEKSLDGTNDKGTCSDGIVIAMSSVAEGQSVLTDSVLENKQPAVEEEFTDDKLETGPTSQWEPKQDMSTGATEANVQSRDDPTAISDVQSSEDGSTVSSILTTDTQTTSDPKGSTQQPRSEKDRETQSEDAVAQSTADNESESSKSSRKAPQTRRGRLVKPKPNLGRGSRPPQSHQVQDTKQAEQESGASSEGVDASVSHKPVSELPPDIQEPVEGAIEQRSNQNSPPHDAESSLGSLTQVTQQLSQHDFHDPDVAGSSLGCVTQAPDSYAQDASAPSAGEAQSHSSFIFPDMLSEQAPSDPEEPFFILSLTEIPVCPPREVEDGGASEPLPYLPATDASKPHASSAPAEGLAAAGDGQDAAACIGVIMENPVDPHESIAVQPSKVPETVENNDETECPPIKQRLTGRRTAKAQVKPKASSSTKQASNTTLAAKEAESVPTQDSELPGPSVQPKASDEVVTEPQTGSGDHVDIEETLTSRKDPEESSSGAQTRQTSSRSRKPKGFPSSLPETNITDPPSDSPPCKAASKGSKAKTPRAAGKRPTRAPVASTSYDVSPTQTPEESQPRSSITPQTQAEVDIEQTSEHSRLCSDTTFSTSPCTAEVSASRQSDDVESSCVEEEPTSVSQYFLSDIFTEVEEG